MRPSRPGWPRLGTGCVGTRVGALSPALSSGQHVSSHLSADPNLYLLSLVFPISCPSAKPYAHVLGGKPLSNDGVLFQVYTEGLLLIVLFTTWFLHAAMGIQAYDN